MSVSRGTELKGPHFFTYYLVKGKSFSKTRLYKIYSQMFNLLSILITYAFKLIGKESPRFLVCKKCKTYNWLASNRKDTYFEGFAEGYPIL